MPTPSNAAQQTFTVTVKTDEQTINLCVSESTSIRLALDATELRVRAACGGLGTCGACLIRIVDGDFNPPTLAERQKIVADDLAQGMRLACQLRARSDAELYLENPAPKSLWKSLDPGQLYQAVSGNAAVIRNIYGVAVDLGTTHIRLSLWNRQTGRRIASRYSINPQVAHGADILTRLDAHRLTDQDNRMICQEARKAIIDGVRDILSRDVGEISAILNAIGEVVIVGNTVMLTLVCGNSGDTLYQLDNWQQSISCLPQDRDAWRRAWRTPNAEINIVQPLAGFIGSDLLADVLATGMAEQSRPMLLADFGTNTEIALWDGQTLWAASVPGGPAFEGVGMRNGLPAEAGAICRVAVRDGEWQLQTISDVPARGFCASGFIDAIACLLERKLLKPSGRFAEPQAAGGYCLDANNPKSAIYTGDIDLFQRAKGATAAAMAQLIRIACLTVHDIQTVWICGSFGRHLDLQSAIRVGLLPPFEPGTVQLLAEASLMGGERLLLEPDAAKLLSSIVERSKVINLGSLLDYEDCFIDHLRLQPIPRTE
ncbi:MAG: ASKHA domain-containing protein [Methylomonas sp.]